MLDAATEKKIDLLHPIIRVEAGLIFRDCYTSLQGNAKPRFTQTLRTFAEQDALYAQGRTKPGQRVTNAKGGQSIHNYGLAIDFTLIIDNKEMSWDVKRDWDQDRQSDWMEVVAIFKKYGWKWGGDWVSFKDMPHFEKTFGYTWQQLLKKYNAGEFLEGTKYVRI